MPLILYRPSLRALLAIGVLLAWGASLGWLGWRAAAPGPRRPACPTEAALRLAPGGAWFAVYAGGVQVGSAGITLDTLSPGYQIVETEMLDVPRGGHPVRSTWRSQTRLSATLGLESVTAHYSSPGRSGGLVGDQPRTTPWWRDRSPASGWPWARSPSPSIPCPAPRSATGWRSRAPRRRVGAGRCRWPRGGHRASGRASSSPARSPPWCTSTVPAPMRWRAGFRRTSESARTVAIISGRSVGSVPAVDRPPRRHRRAADAARPELGAHRFRPCREPLSTACGRGSRRDHRSDAGAWRAHRIHRGRHRQRPAALSGESPRRHPGRYRVAGAARWRTPVGHRRYRSWSSPEPERSVVIGARNVPDDPMIQAEAHAIVLFARPFDGMIPEETTLRAIIDSIRHVVRVDTAAGAPQDALGTLATRRGRPDGIARLFVATVRAAGVPARYVTGVAVIGDTLYTHAWAEVWNPGGRGGWFAVDPVRGLVPAPTESHPPGLCRFEFARRPAAAAWPMPD